MDKKQAKAKARERAIRKMRHESRLYKTQKQKKSDGFPTLLGPDDTVYIPTCNGVGKCCSVRQIFLTPGDVFRIHNNSAVREKFHINGTVDMYGENDKNGILYYYLHDKTGMPVCRMRQEPDGMCVFHDSGECILGDDRPFNCSTSPIVALHTNNEKDFLQMDCTGCSKSGTTCTQKVGDHIESRCSEQKYNDAESYHAFLSMLSKNFKIDVERKLAAMAMFDRDRLDQVFGSDVGTPVPSNGDECMGLAMSILSAIKDGQKKRDEQAQSELAEKPEAPVAEEITEKKKAARKPRVPKAPKVSDEQ